MPTQEAYDQVLEDIKNFNITKDTKNAEAGPLEIQAADLFRDATAALTAANAATADGQLIEAKLATLEGWFAHAIGRQKEEIEMKAGAIMRTMNALEAKVARARDPLTGRRLPLDEVSASLFAMHREAPLTAEEHDSQLTMNAAQFDAHPINAIEYDRNGRQLLA